MSHERSNPYRRDGWTWVSILLLLALVTLPPTPQSAHAEQLVVLDSTGQLHSVETTTGALSALGSPNASLSSLTTLRSGDVYELYAVSNDTELVQLPGLDAGVVVPVIPVGAAGLVDLAGTPCDWLFGLRPPTVDEIIGLVPPIEDCVGQPGSVPQTAAPQALPVPHSLLSLTVASDSGLLYGLGTDGTTVHVYDLAVTPLALGDVLSEVATFSLPFAAEDIFFGAADAPATAALYALISESPPPVPPPPCTSCLVEVDPVTGNVLGVPIVQNVSPSLTDGGPFPSPIPPPLNDPCEYLDDLLPQIDSFFATQPVYVEEDRSPPPGDDETVENTFKIHVRPTEITGNGQCFVQIAKVYFCYRGDIYEGYKTNVDQQTCSETWERTFDIKPFVENEVSVFVVNTLGLPRWDTMALSILLQDKALDEPSDRPVMDWASDMVKSLLKGGGFLALLSELLSPEHFKYTLDPLAKTLTMEAGGSIGTGKQLDDGNEGSPVTKQDEEQESGIKGEYSFGYTIPLEEPESPEVSAEAEIKIAMGGKKFFLRGALGLDFDSASSGDPQQADEYYESGTRLAAQGAMTVEIEGGILLYTIDIPLPEKAEDWLDVTPVEINGSLELTFVWDANGARTRPGSLSSFIVTPGFDAKTEAKFNVKVARVKITLTAGVEFPFHKNADAFWVCAAGSVDADVEVDVGWKTLFGLNTTLWNPTSKPLVLHPRNEDGTNVSCSSKTAEHFPVYPKALLPSESILGNTIACSAGGEVLQVISVDRDYGGATVGGGALPAGSTGPSGNLEGGRILYRRCATPVDCLTAPWTRIPLPSGVDTGSDQHYEPHAVYTSAGVPVVVWVHALQSAGNGITVGDIYYSYDGGAGFVTAQRLHESGSLHFDHSPRIAADFLGNAVVTWVLENPRAGQDPLTEPASQWLRNTDIYYQRLDASQALDGGAIQVSGGSSAVREYPDVAVDGLARTMFVWTSSSGRRPDDGQDIEARYVLSDDTPLPRLTIPVNGPDDMPNVAFDALDQAVISFVKTGGFGACCADLARGSDWIVYSSQEDQGTTYDIHLRKVDGTHVQVTDDPYHQMDPAMATDPSQGCNLIVYSSKEDGGPWFDLWGVAVAANGIPLGNPAQLTFGDYHEIEPDVVMWQANQGEIAYVALDPDGGTVAGARVLRTVSIAQCNPPFAFGEGALLVASGMSGPAYGASPDILYFSGYPGPYEVVGQGTVYPAGESGRLRGSNIYEFDQSSGIVTRLTDSPADQEDPDWSGGLITYTSDEDGERSNEVIFPNPMQLTFRATAFGGTRVSGGTCSGYTYDWSFPGGGADQGRKVNTEFPSAGQKQISVSLLDGNCDQATNDLTVTVFDDGRDPLVVTAKASPSRVRLPVVTVNPDGSPTFGPKNVTIDAELYGGTAPYQVSIAVAGTSISQQLSTSSNAVQVAGQIAVANDHTLLEGVVTVTDDDGNTASCEFPIVVGEPALSLRVYPEVDLFRSPDVPLDVYVMRDDGLPLANGALSAKVGESSRDDHSPSIRSEPNDLYRLIYTSIEQFLYDCGVPPPESTHEFDSLHRAEFLGVNGEPVLDLEGNVVTQTLDEIIPTVPFQLGRPEEMTRYGVSQRVFLQVFTPGPSPLDPVTNGSFLPAPLPVSEARPYARHPIVEVAPDGNAIVAWRERVDGNDRIVVNTASSPSFADFQCPNPIDVPFPILWQHDVCVTPASHALISRVWEVSSPGSISEDLVTADYDIEDVLPDPGNSFVFSNEGAISVNPAGDGQSLQQLDLVIDVGVYDAQGVPIPGIPAANITAVPIGPDMVICEPLIADGPTDGSGFTSISGIPAWGGCSQAGIDVFVEGILLTLAPLPIEINSVDYGGTTSPGVVDLVDLGTFAEDFMDFQYSFCSDFTADGVINLADVGTFAIGLGSRCETLPMKPPE